MVGRALCASRTDGWNGSLGELALPVWKTKPELHCFAFRSEIPKEPGIPREASGTPNAMLPYRIRGANSPSNFLSNLLAPRARSA